MNKFLFFLCSLLIITSFCFYLLGLMRIVPLFYTVIPMFLSILFTVHSWNNRNRFKRINRRSLKG
ncbi:MAG TPA: hypothetical protein GX497_04355 [Bacillus bacterium]|nr:hypothetical protein [Bacillus sp. (in: firmicutes)]